MFKNAVILTICAFFGSTAWAATAPTTTSKTKTSVKSSSEVKDPLSFGFMTENYVSGANLDIGDAARTNSDNHIAMKYKTSEDTTLFLRQYFHFNYYTNTSLKTGNAVVGYKSKHGLIPGGFKLSTQMRLYLPIEAYAQDVGLVQYRFYGALSKPINEDWTFGMQTNPRVYGYTRKDDGQRGLAWKNHVYLSYQASKKISMAGYLGHIRYNYNRGSKFDPEKDITDWKNPFEHDDSAYLDLELVAELTDNITLIGLISQERDLRASNKFEMLNPDETLYFLMGSFNF